jgi:hypothetical protein
MPRKADPKKSSGRRPQLRIVDKTAPPPPDPPRRKLIAFDPDTFAALDLYRRDSMKDWEELAEEAFRDLLEKHGRSADLRTALKRSANDAGMKDVSGKDAADPNKKAKKPVRSKRV